MNSRQITTPLDSPLEGAPRTATYLWMYPGRAGTPMDPLPGPWPTPRQVVDACCRVMDVEGRDLLYKDVAASRRRAQRLVPDDVFGRAHDDLACVSRMFAVHVLHDRCRWYSHPKGEPLRYNLEHLAGIFGRKRSSIWRGHRNLVDAMAADASLDHLHTRIAEELCARFYLQPKHRIAQRA